MTTIATLRIDFETQLRVEQDTDAKVLDCFSVTLPPYVSEPGLIVHREGADLDALWADALAMVAHLRAQPWKAIAPPDHFKPFGVITARNFEDVRREHEWQMSMLLGREHPDDMERVRNAIRAWDLLHDAPLTVPVPWLHFKGLN